MNNKNSKYNNGSIIRLEDIPKEEMLKALNDFSEGSEGLKKCLSIMWKKNLKTLACCAGNDNSFEQAYILMEEGIDLFSYLSESLLLSDMVSINCDNNRQAIFFVGPVTYKEHYFNVLYNDILTGRKKNENLLKTKIGKPIPREWKIHGMVYHMIKNMIPNAGPMKKLKLLSLCKALNESTMEQQKSIIQKCYREISLAQHERETIKKR